GSFFFLFATNNNTIVKWTNTHLSLSPDIKNTVLFDFACIGWGRPQCRLKGKMGPSRGNSTGH
ncbi:MAG TPA: hypothetical protein VIS52_07285, partial [Motiliproteus sp.]